MKKVEQTILLLTCVCVIAVIAILCDGKILGRELKSSTDTSEIEKVKQKIIMVLSDGSLVVNTTELNKEVSRYGSRVPLETYLREGKVAIVKALENSETPDFFQTASSLLSRWNEKNRRDVGSESRYRELCYFLLTWDSWLYESRGVIRQQ